jgi:hypothetical protein
MGHPSSNAVMNFDRVWSGGLEYRIGLQFQLVGQPLSSSLRETLEPVRNIRLQVASPPPLRLDGSRWYDGLRVTDGTEDGRPFDPEDDSWRDLGVFAPEKNGPPNLRQPEPHTLIFDDMITLPLVQASAQRRTATTLLRSGEPVIGEADHFLSVYYETPTASGVRLTAAAVTYHTAGTLQFTGRPGKWVVASLDEFKPDDRTSADYIAPVDPD